MRISAALSQHLRVLRAGGLLTALCVLELSLPMRAASAVDPYARGLAMYSRNELPKALPFLELAAAERPRDPDVLAWLAETYRRLDNGDSAAATARRALALAPCHAFAHQVLGNTFNPQFGTWSQADHDSVWAHLHQAVACDSTDAEAWLGLALEGLRRGEYAVEQTALRELVRRDFLTAATLAFGRWLLRDLPDSAILIVNGDMDTYPVRALQEIEGLRPDVAVVNVSLLELGWYRRMVRDLRRVPAPFEDLENVEPIPGPQGSWVYAAKRMVRGWFAMQEAETLGRPLTIATTVADLNFGRDAQPRLVLHGAFWRAMPEPVAVRVDTMRVRLGLTALRPEEFRGPWISPRDRSPVRRQGTLGHNIIRAAFTYYTACLNGGRDREARAMKEWASSFARTAELDPLLSIAIEDWERNAQPPGATP